MSAVDQIHLTQLVDLALCNPEVGAVNFNHLRTLLLQIIKLTNNGDAVVQQELAKDETRSNVQDPQNESQQKSHSVEGLNTKFEKFQNDHELIKEKLQSLEDDLNSFNKFAANDEILKKKDSNGVEDERNATTAGEKLSETWQHMKLMQRVEVAEKGIDKLFSVMNDVLTAQRQFTEKKEEKVANVHNQEQSITDQLDSNAVNKNIDEMMNEMKKLKEELSAVNYKQTELEQNQPNNIEENNFQKMLDAIRGTIEENKTGVNINRNNLDEVQKSSTEHERLIKELQQQLTELVDRKDKNQQPTELLDRNDENQQQKSPSDTSTQADNIDTNENANKEDMNKLNQKMNELKNQIQAVNSSLSNKADTSAVASVKESLTALDKKLDKSTNDLVEEIKTVSSTKADASDVKAINESLAVIKKKHDDSITTVSDEIGRLKESLSNMDNEELKEITSNFEQLQKMADEIDELRKLSDLKDLADNVDSLKDLRKEMDALNTALGESKQRSEDQTSKFSGLSDKLEEYYKQQQNLDSELSKMQSLPEQQKSFADKESLNNYVLWEDLKKEMENISDMQKERGEQGTDVQGKGYEAQLSSGNDNLLEQVDALKRTQENLVTNVNELLSAQMKIIQTKQVNDRPSSPVFDVSVLAAIQHLAQQNRQQISALQAELNLLKNMKTVAVTLPNDGNKHGGGEKEETNHLAILQEHQVQLSGQLANMLEDTKDEFNRKQKHIDALYEHVDALQNMKADKDDMTSEIDVKADKQALDSKVNMSTFDERYQLLEQALQDALNRLDQFVEQEASLKDSLHKLTTDMDSKMDSDAEKKLKKFMEDRLKDIQKARNNLSVEGDAISDYRNAAGLRKPMSLLYHCISCDRPVDISMRGVMSGPTQNFPAKKSLGPYTSFELDSLRQSRKPQPYDRFNRPCGGQHTTVNTTMYRTQQKNQHQNDLLGTHEKDVEYEDLSITDCVVGKDGHIYRGRFKPNQLPPPLAKRIVTPSARAKYHNKHRFSHSATAPSNSNNKESTSSLPKDEARSSSANILVVDKQSPTSHNGSSGSGGGGGSPLRNSSPLSLPPISRDGSLIGDDVTSRSNDFLPYDEK